MATLDSRLRRELERTVIVARRTAEAAAAKVLQRFALQASEPPESLSRDEIALRQELVAQQSQLSGFQELVEQCAYEHWHRVLFSRFLAENELLIHPEMGVAVSLEDCDDAELQAAYGASDAYELAGRYAAQMLPEIFRPDDPLLRVRLSPEDRIALERLVKDLPDTVFKADDSLGWTYQFWQKERKEAVNRAEQPIQGSDISAVTQLFTEHYMVRFLLENTLGAWWVHHRPDTSLRSAWEYYKPEIPHDFSKFPSDLSRITFLDPCCGSGHFLIEALRLFQSMYEEEGLSPADAADAAITNNLHGLELDPRCTQIAAFNVAFIAWRRGGYRRLPEIQIACCGLPLQGSRSQWEALAHGDRSLTVGMSLLHDIFSRASDLGSLIHPDGEFDVRLEEPARQLTLDEMPYVERQRRLDLARQVAWRELQALLGEALTREERQARVPYHTGVRAQGVARAASLLSAHYWFAVTNPPFLAVTKAGVALRGYCAERHPEAKKDLATCFLERLRNVEFTRDWGLPLQQTIPVDEQILTAAVGIQDNKTGTVKLQSTQYTRGDGFKGWKQSLQQSQSLKEWRLNNTASYASVDLPMYKGYFWRPSLQISRTFKKLSNYTISGSYNLERNDIRSKQTDSVSVQSFSFETIQLGFRSDDSKANKWGISYFTRTDAYPLGKGLLRADRSQNYQFNAELLKSEAHQFRMSATYRSLSIIKDGITGLKADNSLLSRTEYAANILKGMITGNLLYEIGAGQEQKRDLAYLEVPAGQGVYTWIDYNNDGIQQLNEFEEAAFADQRKYILIFTPTNEYIKANYNNFNYQFSLNPRNAIDPLNAKGFKKFISKINLQSSYQVSKKAKSNGDLSFDPFSAKLNDTSLIVLNSVFANSFSFNRFSTKWGFDINSVKTSNKSLLTYGYESREVQDWTTRARWIINKTFTIDGTGRWGYNRLVSSNPKFGNRNYNIDLYSIEPRLSIIRKSNLRIAASYKYANKKNSVGDQERAVSNAIISEIKYTILQKTSIQGKFTYNSIDFSSNASPVNLNAPSAYIMLDGLTPGKNYLWSIDLTKRLSNSLEMNIQYEGRQPGTGRVVHIGRAGIKAIL